MPNTLKTEQIEFLIQFLHPQKIPRHWLLGGMQLTWRNRDLRAVADVICRQPGPSVDLQRVFGHPANPKLLMNDGLHPSLAGQKTIVKALVERLAAGV